jgi:hypothetical protein
MTTNPDSSDDRVRERPLARECAWCSDPIQLNPRAQHQRYCSRSCRQRAYEVRTAARRAQDAQDAGTARPEGEPLREVIERVTVRTVRMGRRPDPLPPGVGQPRVVERRVEVPVEVPVVASPTSAREAADFMAVTAACLMDGSIGVHDHKRVYHGVRALLRAFDQVHPGGLDRLMGGR